VPQRQHLSRSSGGQYSVDHDSASIFLQPLTNYRASDPNDLRQAKTTGGTAFLAYSRWHEDMSAYVYNLCMSICMGTGSP
jgi:hypothetical protein